MDRLKILWADDEIDLLKPHKLFLEAKGYSVITTTNGEDALDLFAENNIDIVFLDENMPGLSGLETLTKIKMLNSTVPVIMITKSEDETIMEDAIGGKISDYLIKPVNPHQILSSIKKCIDSKRLVSEKTNSNYQQEFRNIGMELGDDLDLEGWKSIYKKLIYWELEITKSDDKSMYEILKMQKEEANSLFAKYVQNNYLDWVNSDKAPLMSNNLMEKKVLDKLESDCTFFILIDNLRYDQWEAIKPLITSYYSVESEEMYTSILPTATHYARNAIFSGLMPLEIEEKYPDLWQNEEDDEGKNMREGELLQYFFTRKNCDVSVSYNKITNLNAGEKLAENLTPFYSKKLNVIVYNFVDMLSHARTEMEVIRELANDDKAYRSLTVSWFENSPLFDIIRQLSIKKIPIVLTTDHGTVRVNKPVKIVGDKNSSSNLRYKQGRNLGYDVKDVFEITKPKEAKLPQQNVSTRYVFAKESDYMVYPNSYNHYANYFKHTFQHGGISLEEMLIPIISLKPKK